VQDLARGVCFRVEVKLRRSSNQHRRAWRSISSFFILVTKKEEKQGYPKLKTLSFIEIIKVSGWKLKTAKVLFHRGFGIGTLSVYCNAKHLRTYFVSKIKSHSGSPKEQMGIMLNFALMLTARKRIYR